MDDETMLALPAAEVFSQLAEPARLGDWLPEVSGVRAAAASGDDLDAGFGLRWRRDGQRWRGTGELIAYEPPWSVAYRLRAGEHTYILRLTCTVTDGVTRVQVHQAGDGPPLAVDLAGLGPPLASSYPGPPDPARPKTDEEHRP